MIRIRSSAAAAALVSLSLAACGGAGAPPAERAADVPEAERYGGTIVVGTFGELQPMNRLVSSDWNTNSIQREMLFMPLVKYDEAQEPVPWLAERWDTVRVAPDTLELTFHLRRDVRWHDGAQTTARDVHFTYTRLQDPRTGFPNPAYFQHYHPRAELVDDHTIRFRLRAHAEFLEPWYLTPAMPAHLLEDAAPAEMINHPFGHAPVGNVPFRFVRRAAGREWVFEANEDFPEALGGRPYLDRIVWRMVPEPTTLMVETINGRIDVYLSPTPEQAARLSAAPGVELLDFPFRQWVYIAWNTRLPQFSDARVRRALTMAIDRRQIVDGLVHGYGRVGRGTVTPPHFAYDEDDPETLVPHDPEGARRLLAEAGWRPGPDGILRNADGVPFRFTLMTNHGNDTRKDILDYVQAQLRPLGIDVQPRLVEWVSMLAQLRGNLDADGVRERSFDAVVSSWVDAIRKDDHDQLHSRAMNEPYQYVGYAHPEVDRYIDTVAVLLDRDEARRQWREYERLVVRESPYTVLYFPQRLAAVRTRVRDAGMDSRGDLVGVTRWWIAPGER
jgi:peptide/nickel transport system substrate-binding protein